jgi:hypothetical protein
MTALLFAALAAGCSRPSSMPAAPSEVSWCAFEGEAPLDVAGRADGVYAIEDGHLAARLARFEGMIWEKSGVDAPSGKRWVLLRLGADAENVERYTAGPALRKIAVVVGGRVAAQHKVRTAITSAEMQVSCCDSRACDAWEARLKGR